MHSTTRYGSPPPTSGPHPSSGSGLVGAAAGGAGVEFGGGGGGAWRSVTVPLAGPRQVLPVKSMRSSTGVTSTPLPFNTNGHPASAGAVATPVMIIGMIAPPS